LIGSSHTVPEDPSELVDLLNAKRVADAARVDAPVADLQVGRLTLPSLTAPSCEEDERRRSRGANATAAELPLKQLAKEEHPVGPQEVCDLRVSARDEPCSGSQRKLGQYPCELQADPFLHEKGDGDLPGLEIPSAEYTAGPPRRR
jgi:hypothetical protein